MTIDFNDPAFKGMPRGCGDFKDFVANTFGDKREAELEGKRAVAVRYPGGDDKPQGFGGTRYKIVDGNVSPVVAKPTKGTKGEPRYITLLNMLRGAGENGCVSVEQVCNRWGCNAAAAHALFRDVRVKCGADIVRSDDKTTYCLQE